MQLLHAYLTREQRREWREHRYVTWRGQRAEWLVGFRRTSSYDAFGHIFVGNAPKHPYIETREGYLRCRTRAGLFLRPHPSYRPEDFYYHPDYRRRLLLARKDFQPLGCFYIEGQTPKPDQVLALLCYLKRYEDQIFVSFFGHHGGADVFERAVAAGGV